MALHSEKFQHGLPTGLKLVKGHERSISKEEGSAVQVVVGWVLGHVWTKRDCGLISPGY